jgi:hypothetical protein
MVKKILFAAAITGLMAGAALPLHTTAADATPSGCQKAAKAKFGSDHAARRAYHRECKAHWKMYKTAQKAAKKAA